MDLCIDIYGLTVLKRDWSLQTTLLRNILVSRLQATRPDQFYLIILRAGLRKLKYETGLNFLQQ